MLLLIIAAAAFVACFIGMPIVLGVLRAIGAYAVIEERRAYVYTLFGSVVAVLDEPGLTCLWLKMGPRALIMNWLGKRYEIDLRLDQSYLRSQAVNSEEGAPMGIGIWYEMWVSNPTSYLFKNADPRGSLRANVSNATVRSLSNLKLSEMLENRHAMSLAVRTEVSPHSQEWGYQLGSVYVRKVHFRDEGMTKQIEEKVVNRLRQVTSAIRQDGANQVSIITSTADRQAAIEFAKAAALRPSIVGAALQRISRDPDVATALFEILGIQRVIDGPARVTLVPAGKDGVLSSLLAAGNLAGQPGPNGPTIPISR